MKRIVALALEMLDDRTAPAIVGYPDLTFGESGRMTLQDF